MHLHESCTCYRTGRTVREEGAVALRYHRRGGLGGRVTAEGAVAVTASAVSVGGVARVLQQERIRQGLSLTDVSSRTGISATQLRSSEAGVLHFSDDQLTTLRAIWRYADFLGLPGERFVLALVEQWPTSAEVGRHRELAARREQSGEAPASNELSHLALPATATLPALVPAASRLPETEGAEYAFDDTGVSPAVSAPSSSMAWQRSRRNPSFVLKGLVGMVAVAVVVALGALTVDRIEPSWLRALGASSVPSTAAPPHARTTPRTTVRSRRTHASPPRQSASTPAGSLPTPSTTASSAVYHVGSSPFTLSVAATGGRCWVEMSYSSSTPPLFSGVLMPGQSRTFTIDRSATVDLGSTAGRISVSIGGRDLLSTTKLPTAPYRVMFTSSR